MGEGKRQQPGAVCKCSEQAWFVRKGRPVLPCAQTPLPAAGAVGSAGMLRSSEKRPGAGRGWAGGFPEPRSLGVPKRGRAFPAEKWSREGG